jgi:hypothetical protein
LVVACWIARLLQSRVAQFAAEAAWCIDRKETTAVLCLQQRSETWNRASARVSKVIILRNWMLTTSRIGRLMGCFID